MVFILKFVFSQKPTQTWQRRTCMPARCSGCAVKPWNRRCTRMTSGLWRLRIRNGPRFDLRDYLRTMISSATVKSKSWDLLAVEGRGHPHITTKFRGIALPRLWMRFNLVVSRGWTSRHVGFFGGVRTTGTLFPRISRKSLRLRAIVRNWSSKFYRGPSFSDDLNSGKVWLIYKRIGPFSIKVW